MFADRPMTSATGAITEDSAVTNTSLAGAPSLIPARLLGWILRPFLIASKKFSLTIFLVNLTMSSTVYFLIQKHLPYRSVNNGGIR